VNRACANHPDRNCIKDVSSQASSSSLTSKRNFAAPADAEESEPEEVIIAISFLVRWSIFLNVVLSWRVLMLGHWAG
jgi:hypothetical protein